MLAFGTHYYRKPKASERLAVEIPDIEQLARSRFTVKEHFALPDGELEFQIAYDEGTKQKFAEFQPEATKRGFRPELTGTKEDCVLTLRKKPSSPKGRSRVPVVVALLTIASLAVFGYLQQTLDNQLLPSLSGYVIFFGFTATVAVIMGGHELGRRLATRRAKSGRPNTYLLPGIPFITSFLPSLGFVNTQSEPALNRDRLFDAVVAGPLAILLLSLLFYVIGVMTATQSTVPFQNTNLVNTTISINPNALQLGIDAVLGHLAPTAPAGYNEISPIADGASFGFVLAFVGFLPMALYDGGLLSSIAWGEKAARATTYLSVLLLLIIDIDYATYWAVAIVALLIAGRPIKLKLLDEVSGVSTSRQWIFVGTLVLALLCLPIPHSIATFSLG